MTNIKELKQDNKNVMHYLHDGFGFDFQKPFTIVKQDGKFTANLIKSIIAKEISDFSDAEYETALLIHPYDYNGKIDRLHAVVLDGDKFDVDVPRGYRYDIDTFYNKCDFKNTRKNKTAHYYIIAQKKEYLQEKNVTRHDVTVRFKYYPTAYECYGDGNGNTYYSRVHIKELHINGDPFYFDIRYRHIKALSEIIDKSGYLTVEFRSKLMNRVCTYKNKKRKTEFLATDYSCSVKALDLLIGELKTEIAESVKNITTYSQARFVERAMDKFAWGLSYFTTYKDRIAEKDYDSKEHAENSGKNIRGYIDAAFEALREAANETDDK